jgi:hypothetical protein
MVLAARGLPGVKVALAPEQATVPVTPPERVKVDVVIVAQFIASLKFAVST